MSAPASTQRPRGRIAALAGLSVALAVAAAREHPC